MIELDKIVAKIVEKAELICKLNMPKQWGQPNEKKGKRIFIAPDSELGDKQDEARLEKLPTSE